MHLVLTRQPRLHLGFDIEPHPLVSATWFLHIHRSSGVVYISSSVTPSTDTVPPSKCSAYGASTAHRWELVLVTAVVDLVLFWSVDHFVI
jgi:hypothetical protein